jgi:hypothetical protein
VSARFADLLRVPEAVCLFDEARPLVPGKRGADMVGRAPLHADISDDLSAGPKVARVVNYALLKNDAYSKPIVAAVNGDCTGGGLELLLSTDIRAGVPEARFGLPEVGDLSVRRPGTAPIRSRIAAHCAYGDCLRPKLRWRVEAGWSPARTVAKR